MRSDKPVLSEWTKKIDRDQLSPMMIQYLDQKEKWPDCLLFFRLGDFYEMFFDDALIAAKELEIALTSRDCGLKERAPMCGVPYHSADGYINKLIERNYKIAICEQVEDPASAKGLVRREVVRVITPGTVTDINNLDEKKNNYLVSVYQLADYFGIAAMDLSTGSFEATFIAVGATHEKLLDEIERFKPAEMICNEMFVESGMAERVMSRREVIITAAPDETFDYSVWSDYLPESEPSKVMWGHAASGILSYIKKTQVEVPDHIRGVRVYSIADHLHLDVSARKNLELTETLRDQSRKGSLLWTLDRTCTAMGGRMLRNWVEQPLINPHDIGLRLDAVEELKDRFIERQELRDRLQGLSDIVRLNGKLSMGNVNARDLVALTNALQRIPAIKECVAGFQTQLIRTVDEQLDPLTETAGRLTQALNPDPPIQLKEGGLIREGFDERVDQLREADKNGRQWILDLEAREREKTGVKNLKVGYNRVFGYYIEITKSNYDLIPAEYIRKQTLANSERFYTEELKSMEDRILGAQQRVIDLEYELFCEIRDQVREKTERLDQIGLALSTLDTLQALAEQADRGQYCKPIVDLSDQLLIRDGRHPVVEKMLGPGEFVPNDTLMDMRDNRMMLITGPNMSGKSTYMRQVAQIVLLAQMGSFVPASHAHIGVTDSIFTRIGASDDLSAGDSTFMVEMKEVASIMSQATARSLLILDEIGRGTSTYDGLSIAWAVIEEIADTAKLGCRTLFATHYHELTDLEGVVVGIQNYHVKVDEQKDDIVFLHKIERGGTDESYGVEVAKLAGVPSDVVARARELLAMLEKANDGKAKLRIRQNARPMDGQIDLFSSSLALRQYDSIIDQLKELDVQKMTPLDALNTLYELAREAQKIDRKGD